jgi:hypothetical protein
MMQLSHFIVPLANLKTRWRRKMPAGWTLRLFCLFCLLSLGTARAGSVAGSVADLDADDGLPDARIGEPMTSFTGLQKTEDVGRWLTFVRPGDKLEFLGVKLKGITYNFFKERLYSIDLELSGKHNVDSMLKALERHYGKAHSLETRTYAHTNAQMEVREWTGVKMYCDYKSAVDGTGAELVLLDRPTWDLLQVPKEERAAASREMLKGSYTNGDF